MATEYLETPMVAAAAIGTGIVVSDTGAGAVAACTAGTDATQVGITSTNAPAAGDEIAVVTSGRVLTQQIGALAIPAGARVVAANGGVAPFDPGAYAPGDVVTIVGIARTSSTSAGQSLSVDVGLDTVVI